jgi:hypothetical protein
VLAKSTLSAVNKLCCWQESFRLSGRYVKRRTYDQNQRALVVSGLHRFTPGTIPLLTGSRICRARQLLKRQAHQQDSFQSSAQNSPELPAFADNGITRSWPGAAQVMVDFHACRWPSSMPTSHDTSIAEYFDNLNEPALSNLSENMEMEEEEGGRRSPLITFSHFLPLQVLLQSTLPHLVSLAYSKYGCPVDMKSSPLWHSL